MIDYSKKDYLDKLQSNQKIMRKEFIPAPISPAVSATTKNRRRIEEAMRTRPDVLSVLIDFRVKKAYIKDAKEENR